MTARPSRRNFASKAEFDAALSVWEDEQDGVVYVATADALRCDFMAVGTTEQGAKTALVRAYWKMVKQAGWVGSVPVRDRSVAAFDDYYCIRVDRLAPGQASIDGTVQS
jgi:hypothetical protein